MGGFTLPTFRSLVGQRGSQALGAGAGPGPLAAALRPPPTTSVTLPPASPPQDVLQAGAWFADVGPNTSPYTLALLQALLMDPNFNPLDLLPEGGEAPGLPVPESPPAQTGRFAAGTEPTSAVPVTIRNPRTGEMVTIPDIRPIARAQDGVVSIGREKACKMLEDGEVNGKPLSKGQKRLFGAVCSGQTVRQARNGAVLIPRDAHIDLMEAHYG